MRVKRVFFKKAMLAVALTLVSQCFSSVMGENMPALGPPELEYPLNGATTIMVSLICKNYVMIYKRKRHYIAAQGPTPLTLSDFWRLLWVKTSGGICFTQ